jgi:hypothetical protein
VAGKFVHFNTIEEFRAFELDQSKLKEYGVTSGDGKSMPNFFVFLCFGDLKNYDYFYSVSLVQGPERLQTVKGKKLVKALEASAIEQTQGAIKKFLDNYKEEKVLP